MTRKEHTT